MLVANLFTIWMTYIAHFIGLNMVEYLPSGAIDRLYVKLVS